MPKQSGDGDESTSMDCWQFQGLRGKLLDEEGILKKELVAQSATIAVDAAGRMIPVLYHGKFTYGQEGDFERFNLPPVELFAPRKSKVRLSMRSFSALQAMRGREEKAYPEHQITTELHKRIADSFGPLVFVCLALPVTILFRHRNRMVAFLIAILITFFVYYPVWYLGGSFAKEGILPPVLSIWAGNLFLASLGLGFVWKVMRR
jgi:lipopolysaccharide export LptBFGC system permease protein LptF